MSNTIPKDPQAAFINLVQRQIAALRKGDPPEKVLKDRIEIDQCKKFGTDRFIEMLEETIEHEKTRDHW